MSIFKILITCGNYVPTNMLRKNLTTEVIFFCAVTLHLTQIYIFTTFLTLFIHVELFLAFGGKNSSYCSSPCSTNTSCPLNALTHLALTLIRIRKPVKKDSVNWCFQVRNIPQNSSPPTYRIEFRKTTLDFFSYCLTEHHNVVLQEVVIMLS